MYSGEEDVEEISDEEAQAPAAAEDAAVKEGDKEKADGKDQTEAARSRSRSPKRPEA